MSPQEQPVLPPESRLPLPLRRASGIDGVGAVGAVRPDSTLGEGTRHGREIGCRSGRKRSFRWATDWSPGVDRQSSWPGPVLPGSTSWHGLAKQLARASGTVLVVVLNQACNPDPPLVRRYLGQSNAAKHPRWRRRDTRGTVRSDL